METNSKEKKIMDLYVKSMNDDLAPVVFADYIMGIFEASEKRVEELELDLSFSDRKLLERKLEIERLESELKRKDELIEMYPTTTEEEFDKLFWDFKKENNI